VYISSTNPFSPQQNGIAERRVRRVCEMAKSILSEGKMPFIYWPAAVATSVYIINRLKSNATKSIPYEERTGRKVDYSVFKIWGCRAWTHIPKEKRSKFDDKAVECILIGYSDNGYILEEIESRKLVYSRNVTFNEDLVCFDDATDESDGEDIDIGSEYYESSDDDSKETREPETRNENDDEYSANENDDTNNSFHTPVGNRSHERFTYEEISSEEDENLITSLSTKNILTKSRRAANIVYKDKTLDEALCSPDAKDWILALETEYDNLMSMGTWTEEILPEGRKSIPCKTIMHRKNDGRFRPRLVLKGFKQKKRN
jgi:hypothetical protein